MGKSLIKTVLIGIVAAAVLIFAALNVMKPTASSPASENRSSREITGSSIGGGFSLIGEDGEVFTDQDLTRRYRLIYFGFTYCPAICPTELAKIVNAFNKLPESLQEKIDLLFITIDPERDNAEVLAQYTDMFHPRMIGLGGDQAQIDTVLKQYKVYATKVQDETMSDYTMDHSSYIYLFNKENQLRAMYRMSDDADFIATDLPKVLK